MLIDHMVFFDGPRVVSWSFHPAGKYTMVSMYAKVSQEATLAHFNDVWAARIPLKVKIFDWQLGLDRLPSSIQVVIL